MKKKEEREPVSSGYCLMHNYIKEKKKKRKPGFAKTDI